MVSCGHPPALFRRGDGQLSLIDAPSGLPLGMGLSDVEPYREHVVPWTPGDRLLLYTDGLSEARDLDGRFLSPLMLGAALSAPDTPAAMDAVLEAVGQHTPDGHLTDDLALLLLERTTPAAPPRAAARRTRRPTRHPAEALDEALRTARNSREAGARTEAVDHALSR